ncbi:hypothetical protein D3C81_2328180 [compost metagenome]
MALMYQLRASPLAKAAACPAMSEWATSKNLPGAAQRPMAAAVAAAWTGWVGRSRKTSLTLPVSM